MADKKNPGRFTIQFNPGDPKQLSVSELLEQQGRHKAQFITNAVLHYIHCPETPEIPEPHYHESHFEWYIYEGCHHTTSLSYVVNPPTADMDFLQILEFP